MGRKELKSVAAQLADIPETEERVLLATGRYLGEGFDRFPAGHVVALLCLCRGGTIARTYDPAGKNAEERRWQLMAAWAMSIAVDAKRRRFGES